MDFVNTVRFAFQIGQRIYRNGSAYLVEDVTLNRVFARHILNGRASWFPIADFWN